MDKTERDGHYDIAIAGLGAAGGFALCAAGSVPLPQGASILAVERTRAPFRKIAASGNGRCNFSNASIADNDYYSSSAPPQWRRAFVSTVAGFDLGSYLCERGVPSRRDEYGRLFPYTNSAKTVTAFLARSAKARGAKILHETSVAGVAALPGGGFELSLEGTDGTRQKVATRFLICAAGGSAYPKLGTDGSFFKILEKLGHPLVAPAPAIVALVADLGPLRQLSGLKMETVITTGGGYRRKGELLFTDYGVSGPNVLYASCSVAQELSRNGRAEISINFLPEKYMTPDYFVRAAGRMRAASAAEALAGALDERFVGAFMKPAPGNAKNRAGRADLEGEIRKAVERLKDYRMNVSATLGFDDAQVSLGGISCASVDPETMESRALPGLYIVGEAIDFTGGCGGYNIHMAAATAFAAVRDIARKMGRGRGRGEKEIKKGVWHE